MYPKQKIKVTGKGEMSKVLGHHWDCTNDEFMFDFETLAGYTDSLNPISKRNILRLQPKCLAPWGSYPLLSSETRCYSRNFRRSIGMILYWDDIVQSMTIFKGNGSNGFPNH